jgi:[ribosomal protein S5]-alanine N-acetyltransferase
MSTTVNPPEIFETNRIVGRKPTMDDAQGMFDAYATDPEVTRFLVFKPYEKLEDLQTWLSYIIKEWEKSPGIMYLLYRHNAPTQ